MASFHVAMGRIQQLALSKANCKVPCPEDQLARLRSKQGKAERMKLGLLQLFTTKNAGPLYGCLHYHIFFQKIRTLAKEVRSCWHCQCPGLEDRNTEANVREVGRESVQSVYLTKWN